MALESGKTFGGIGALMMFIGVFPLISYYGIIEIIGAILIVVALHNLGSYYKESSILTNAIYGVAVGAVGTVIAAFAVFYTVLTSMTEFLQQMYPGWSGDWSTLQNMTPDPSNLDPSAILPFLIGILVVLLIIWVFAIISTFFIRRSLKQVSNKSNVGLFGTTGMLLLIGAIIPLLGLILMWISALLLAIAFFTLKPQEQAMASANLPPPPAAV